MEIELSHIGEHQKCVQKAYDRLKSNILYADFHQFSKTSLEDVVQTARSIEDRQNQRRSMQNLRRLQPLFETLQHFSGAFDTLCQGTPYLCFVWAPIKLMLVIFDGFREGFEELIKAYAEIARNLPRFERLRHVFAEKEEFQAVLTTVYSDIIDFHLELYKIARRGGLRKLFGDLWRDRAGRIRTINESLRSNRDLVDREASSLEIEDAMNSRQLSYQALRSQEQEREDIHRAKVFEWLGLEEFIPKHQDELESLMSKRHESTCEWVLEHEKVAVWLDTLDSSSLLWLTGKPGSGKSTIAAYLVQTDDIAPASLVVCCLVSEIVHNAVTTTADKCNLLFALICATILRSQQDILPYIYEKYVKTNATNTTRQLRSILQLLLGRNDTTFIIIDGLDEFTQKIQERVFSELRLLFQDLDKSTDNRTLGASVPCKLMICSRETKDLLQGMRRFQRKPSVVKLSDRNESIKIDKDIAAYTHAELRELLEDRFELSEISEVERRIVGKADGMFLWVQLMLKTVNERHSLQSLRDAVDQLPQGLNGIYKAILDRNNSVLDDRSRQQARNILTFVTFAWRPLKIHEACDGLVFQTEPGRLNECTFERREVLDICKPFIEDRAGETVTLVHMSAREYLGDPASGPYLDSQKSHLNIVLMCLRYLQTTQIFVDVPLSHRTLMETVHGYHDLFPYVHSFMVDHLRSCNLESLDQSQLEALNSKLSKLTWLMSPDTEPSKADEEPLGLEAKTSQPAQSVPGDASFSRLGFPEAFHRYILWRIANAQPSSAMPGILDARKDPTNLSRAYANYRQTCERFLNDDADLSTIPPEKIAAFRKRHGKLAYLCRWVRCQQTLTGFRTEAEREQHETRSHKSKFHCPDPACGIWFPNKQAYRRHQMNYHVTENDWIETVFTTPKPTPAEELAVLHNENIVDLDVPWHMSPNKEVIKGVVIKLIENLSREEAGEIKARMSRLLKQPLEEDDIDPVVHHFRRMAQNEFCRQQVNARGPAQVKATPPKKLFKNTIVKRQTEAEYEAEAGLDIDWEITDLLSPTEQGANVF